MTLLSRGLTNQHSFRARYENSNTRISTIGALQTTLEKARLLEICLPGVFDRNHNCWGVIECEENRVKANAQYITPEAPWCGILVTR